MNNHEKIGEPNKTISEESNLLNLVHRYAQQWQWFVISMIITLSAALLYLRYKAPLYEARATILIKDDKKGGGLSELSAFEDLGLLKSAKNLDNEIEILKSRSLMTLVAQELKLNLRYFVDNKPIDKEHFDDAPISFVSKGADSLLYNLSEKLVIVPKDNLQFTLFDKSGNNMGQFNFGTEVTLPFGKFSIIPTCDLQKSNLLAKEIRIEISPMEEVVDEFRKVIQIDPVNKTSNVISISLKDPLREKAEAIVNNLIKQHNADAIADKNLVSKNTAEFINERIHFITDELSDVEEEVEKFKTAHKLVDVESEAKLFLESGSASENVILEANTQRSLAEFMYDYLIKHNNPIDLIPANLGLADPAISGIIVEYNKMVLNRNRLLKSSSEKNPVVENLRAQLDDLRASIRESLSNLKNGLDIKIAELSRQESGIDSKISTVPKYERQYRMIQRQQQIKETLYLYLLQKREETNIALAVTVANAKVIDHAYSSAEPVAPKNKVIIILGLLAGFVLPVIGLYVQDLLDNKVHGKRDIDEVGVPFLGDIPNTDSKRKMVVQKGDNSSVAEAFRLLRTNVDFMMTGVASQGRTIFLTSTLGKEGKSFIALNLAASLAISGKKVLLVGMDVRMPRILEYLELESQLGITNYISSNDLSLDDVIMKQPVIENLDILPSGAVPPNPSELLMKEKVADLFASIRSRYDYIIVDTAPIGMVTDTLLLSKYADAFVYVVRAYYLDRRLLSVASDLYKEKRLPNMAVLINGTNKEKGYGYGYGYGYGGYGYGHEKPRSLLKRIFGRT